MNVQTRAESEYLADIVDSLLDQDYSAVRSTMVPSMEEAAAARVPIEFGAACLYFDVRRSSTLMNVAGPELMARLLSALARGAAVIADQRDGKVCDLHGDAALIIFTGDGRAERAVEAALQLEKFVFDMLRPLVARHLGPDGVGFDTGIGVDVGWLHVVGVKTGLVSGAIWEGRCTNTAAKLANISRTPAVVAITGEVYDLLSSSLREAGLWNDEINTEVAGVDRRVRTLRRGALRQADSSTLPVTRRETSIA